MTPPRRDPAHIRPLRDDEELIAHRAEVYQAARRELKAARAIGTDEDQARRERDLQYARGFLEMSLRGRTHPFVHSHIRYYLDEQGAFHAEDHDPRRNTRDDT